MGVSRGRRHRVAPVVGGFTGRAYQCDADITRKINGQVLTGRLKISAPVLAGDTVYVRERLF